MRLPRNERKLNEMHIAPGNQGNPDKKCWKWEILNTVSQFQWKLYISECVLCIITPSVFALPENCPVNAKNGANNSKKKTSSNFTVKWARVWGCKKATHRRKATTTTATAQQQNDLTLKKELVSQFAAVCIKLCTCVRASVLQYTAYVVNCCTHCVNWQEAFSSIVSTTTTAAKN